MGYSFEKLGVGVVVSGGGSDAQIHHSVFVSSWLSDTRRISIIELWADDSRIVIVDQDASLHTPPKRIYSHPPEYPRTDHSKRPRSPILSQPTPILSVPDYQPTPPTTSQLDLPESERPPSWSTSEVSHPPKTPCPSSRDSEAETRNPSPPTLNPAV